MDNRPSLDQIFTKQPAAQTRPSLDQIFTKQPAAQTRPQAPKPVPTQEPSFTERVGQDVEKRRQIGAELVGTPAEKFTAGIGKVGAGLVGDVIGEAGKSIGQAAMAATPEDVKQGAADISGQWVKENPAMAEKLSAAGKFGISMAERGADVYKKWAEQNPRVAQQLESVVNILGVIPQMGAIGKATGAAAKVTPVVGPIIKGAKVPSVEALKETAATGLKTAGSKIQTAKTSGAVLHPDIGSEISQKLSGVIDITNDVKVGANKATLEPITRLKNVLSEGNTSLDNLIITRNELTKAMGAGGENATSALEARKILDAAMNRAVKEDKIVGGDPSAIKLYKQGMEEVAMMKRYEDIVTRLSENKGSASKIKAQMSRLVDSDDFKYFSPDIKRLIRKAAAGKTSGNILEIVDKLSHAIPVVGQLTGMVIGGVVGKGAKTIAMGTVGDILTAIKAGK